MGWGQGPAPPGPGLAGGGGAAVTASLPAREGLRPLLPLEPARRGTSSGALARPRVAKVQACKVGIGPARREKRPGSPLPPRSRRRLVRPWGGHRPLPGARRPGPRHFAPPLSGREPGPALNERNSATLIGPGLGAIPPRGPRAQVSPRGAHVWGWPFECASASTLQGCEPACALGEGQYIQERLRTICFYLEPGTAGAVLSGRVGGSLERSFLTPIPCCFDQIKIAVSFLFEKWR